MTTLDTKSLNLPIFHQSLASDKVPFKWNCNLRCSEQIPCLVHLLGTTTNQFHPHSSILSRFLHFHPLSSYFIHFQPLSFSLGRHFFINGKNNLILAIFLENFLMNSWLIFVYTSWAIYIYEKHMIVDWTIKLIAKQRLEADSFVFVCWQIDIRNKNQLSWAMDLSKDWRKTLFVPWLSFVFVCWEIDIRNTNQRSTLEKNGGRLWLQTDRDTDLASRPTTGSISWFLSFFRTLNIRIQGDKRKIQNQEDLCVFLAALAALYLPLASVTDWLPLLNFDTKSDFWDLRPFRHLIS